MIKYTSHLRGNVPQSEALPGQVENSAGGFSFAVDDWKRLDRFLVLGTDGGTYYASERALTRGSAEAAIRCIKEDGRRVVRRIVEISDAGRAPKNDPALFALALAAKLGDVDTRREAFAALPRVARIGTHLFHFAEYVKGLGGWGRGTMRGFARWYTEMDVDDLVLQVIKYQQRDGWSHRDLLRKAHPKAPDHMHESVFSWVTGKWTPGVKEEIRADDALGPLWAFEAAKTADTAELCRLIREYRLPRECVPTESLGKADVWEALLPTMGVTALLRNLGKMTAVGVIAPLSRHSSEIAARLTDPEQLRRGRVHPLSLLVALNIYGQGHGDKGSLKWTPDQRIVDALDAAFYLAFKTTEPTGRRHLLGLDVSGSMDCGHVAGMSGITPRIGAAAMALVTSHVESECHMMAFSHQLVKLNITPRSRLDHVVAGMRALPFGGTDCSLPIRWATQQRVPVDAFVTYTDSETWAGDIHACEALRQYRQVMGIGARMVVVAMTSAGFTIADPNDAGSMDVVGMDSATPALIADFVRGNF